MKGWRRELRLSGSLHIDNDPNTNCYRLNYNAQISNTSTEVIITIIMSNLVVLCPVIIIIITNYTLNTLNTITYRRDPNKSGGGTQSFSIIPYSLNSSSKYSICCGGIFLRWIQLAQLWRFLNFHLEHPQIIKIEEKIVRFFGGSLRVILQNLRVF